MRTLVFVIATVVLAAVGSSNLPGVAYAQSRLAAPTNIAAENAGTPGHVRIAWDEVPDAAYYRIGWVAYSDVEPIITSGGEWLEHFAFIDIENRGQTEHTITRLTPGVQYAFIMASNDGRYGTPRWPSSAGWAYLTLDEAPATAASIGSTRINLAWDTVPGAGYYRIGWVVYEDVAPIIASDGEWLEHFAFIDISNRGQTEHTIGRLTPGLEYAFIVAGNDGRYGTPDWPPATAWQFLTPGPAQSGQLAPDTNGDPSPDRAVLVALYYATDGRNWNYNTNWLSDRPVREWWGVGTDRAGRVTYLHLGNNALSGRIPGELGDLANLEVLELSENQLSGPIPDQLSHLSNLTELYLGFNQLSGPIPQQLGDLANLEVLRLRYNQLSGPIPQQLGDLSNLTELLLGFNAFSGPIPPQIGDLANLGDLHLGENQLRGAVPSALGNLSNLENLYLGGNQLSGAIPSELGNLSDLERLNLGENQLRGAVPSALGNLSDLERLNLDGNELSGAIPSELGNLSDLQTLSLYGSQLSGAIPSELGNLSNLQYLNLGGNK